MKFTLAKGDLLPYKSSLPEILQAISPTNPSSPLTKRLIESLNF